MPRPGEKIHEITEEHVSHCQDIIDAQSAAIWIKYRKGQLANGDNLWEKSGLLQHALDEAADLPCYLYSLYDQMTKLAERLEAGTVTGPEASAEILRWLTP